MTAEKAIEHLENIAIFSFQDGYTDEARKALDMAIEALEKQIPKVPVMDYGFGEKIRQVMISKGDKEKAEYKTDCCPVCKRPLGISKFVRSKTGMRFGDLYCKHCGQAILWE